MSGSRIHTMPQYDEQEQTSPPLSERGGGPVYAWSAATTDSNSTDSQPQLDQSRPQQVTPSTTQIVGLGGNDDDDDPHVVVWLNSPGIHAPSPGLPESCDSCAVLNMGGLGTVGLQRCDSCNRLAEVHGERGGRGGGDTAAGMSKARGGGGRGNGGGVKAKEVAVTSARRIALDGSHLRVLGHTGRVMLGAAMLLLVLLLIAWEGLKLSLVTSFSPWLAIYVPIPLGLLNGTWSVYCSKAGYLEYQGTGSCMSQAGFCGTAWGCSGPSCALNLGLDLGLLITSLLATLPAGAAPRGCGYKCLHILCFPCAPIFDEAMAAFMVLSLLTLAVAVTVKMWVMTIAVRKRGSPELYGPTFLPW